MDPIQDRERSARYILPQATLFALFSGAFLVFSLQPLMSRLTTPLLGGSAAVWNASGVFFQGALLAGYLYAHLLSRIKDLRLQAGLHLCALALAALALPPGITELAGAPDWNSPAAWLVRALAVSVGAPFAVISATAPLLQHWYARSGGRNAKDPYYLYAASNAGSLAALLLYPSLIEPLLGLSQQAAAWTAGFVILYLLTAIAGAAAYYSGAAPEPERAKETGAVQGPSRLYWLTAAAIPAALLPGVTLHITTNIASAPLLWIAPLALYLLTFIIAFSRGAERSAKVAGMVLPFAVILLLGAYIFQNLLTYAVPASLNAFFFGALVCHSALAATRPPAARLTEYYLCLSAGGVAGGAAAALLAPLVFQNVYEYPLAMAAAVLFLPKPEGGPAAGPVAAAAAAAGSEALMAMRVWLPSGYSAALALGAASTFVLAGKAAAEAGTMARRFLPAALAGLALLAAALSALPEYYNYFSAPAAALASLPAAAVPAALALLCLPAAAAFVRGLLKKDFEPYSAIAVMFALFAWAAYYKRGYTNASLDQFGLGFMCVAACAGAAFLCRRHPVALALALLCGFYIVFARETRAGEVLRLERSFFGVLRVRDIRDPAGDPLRTLRVMRHGNTIHGAQLTAPSLRRMPLTYYNPRTSLGDAVLIGLSGFPAGARVGVVGLGAGATACLLRPADKLTIFELDPAVVTAAREDFTYLKDCAPSARLVLGDGRLTLAAEPDGAFDLLVIDAFSSDAIPVHLLTREALALYLSKLSPKGLLALHLSNSNMALLSEAARGAEELGAPALFRISHSLMHAYAGEYGAMVTASMLLIRPERGLNELPLDGMPDWHKPPVPSGRAWSDDYSNVARAILDSVRGSEFRRFTRHGIAFSPVKAPGAAAPKDAPRRK